MSGFGGRRERLPACSPGFIDRTRSKYVGCVFHSTASRCVCIHSCTGTVLFMPTYTS